MEEEKELKLDHKVVETDHKSVISLTEKRMQQVLMIACMEYLVNHLRNHDGYNFQHAWYLLSGLNTPAGHLLRNVDRGELNRAIGPIPDDDGFEDIMRVGVQALSHACYLEDWEVKIGQYLHPNKNAFII